MPTTLIIVAAVAILIILLATASYKVCPADRVMVITGPGGRRFVSGGSAFIIPFIMRVDWLSLGAVQSLLRTDTPIPTKDAILIDVNAVANFQIASETMTVDENGKQVKALENAAKNYLNQSKERMEKDVTQVLLGKLREVIGRTELKALMENRDTFAATVAESARVDMERLGLQLTTFNSEPPRPYGRGFRAFRRDDCFRHGYVTSYEVTPRFRGLLHAHVVLPVGRLALPGDI